ncbi:DNA-binding transcriptional regulator, MarR family [Actinacidiphila alni]|uniref:DNA-binding transcriptional regulator, MarR family n=1 Tax=Actinacidiphila alni TaxID=380248 RepID=A0A1I2DAJ3_9ACTN|nr:MarR family transcriptional regulator [Actinacidiphila alni]SFE77451.1 DNA-binding transcriptional regulator, MarR family [Actinacidiphila alni]
MDDYALSVETADAELPPALAEYAAHLLRRAYIRANRLAPDFGDGRGEGAAGARDFQILDALTAPAAYSQQDLGERLGINRTTMVKLIDRLERAGQVTRARNPGDRRSYVLALTDDGRSAVKAMEPAMAAGDDRLTAALDPAERARLDALLGTLLARTPAADGVFRTGSLIAQSHHFVRRRIEDALTDVGLQARHFGALTVLADDACSQQLLARRLGISEQAILQIVDDLESAGRVVRERDPADRRRYALRLTDAGRTALATARRAVEAAEADMGRTLGTEGRAELKALLTKLLRADV